MPILWFFGVQLEEKCSKQQEQIESLQEQLKHDREKFQSKLTTLQSDLGTKLDQVYISLYIRIEVFRAIYQM